MKVKGRKIVMKGYGSDGNPLYVELVIKSEETLLEDYPEMANVGDRAGMVYNIVDILGQEANRHAGTSHLPEGLSFDQLMAQQCMMTEDNIAYGLEQEND